MKKTAIDIDAIQSYALVLEQSKSTSDYILDTLPVLFFILNDSGRIIKINELAARHFQVSEDRVLGANFISLLSEEGQVAFQRYFLAALIKPQHSESFEVSEDRDSQRYLYWQVYTYQQAKAFERIHVLIGFDTSALRQAHSKMIHLKKDFETAESVQKRLMPASPDFETATIRGAACYEAAENVGGDWWWYQKNPSGDLAIMVGDVSGHGVDAAIATAVTVGAHHVLCEGFKDHGDLMLLLSELNRYFLDLNKGLHLMTITAFQFHPKTHKGSFYFCGSPAIYVTRAGQTKTLSAGGNPLGYTKELQVGRAEFDLQKGDRIFVGTDGSYGFRMESGLMFTQKRLRNLINKLAPLPLPAARDGLKEEIMSARGTARPDDLTFIVLECLV